MGPGGVQSVVRLRFLESVRPALLVEFIEPYRKELAALGMKEDEIPGSHPWLVRLFRVLSREDVQLPSGLVSGLVMVGALSSYAGQESLTEHARVLGVSLDLDGGVLAAPDAALHAYLHYPKVCSLAYRRMRPASVQRLAEFAGKSLPSAGIPTLSAVRELLDRWVEGHAALRFRMAQVEERSGHLVFRFAHEVRPSELEGHSANRQAPARPSATCDVVAYDVATNGLSISVDRAEDEDLYRAMAGLVLTGDPDHFAASSIYTSAPFFEHGRGALDTRAVEGIDRVSLVRVRLASWNDSESWTELSGDAAMGWLDQVHRTGHLYSQGVIDWSFEVILDGERSPLLIDVSPPNRMRGDSRVPLQQFRKFMVERGFFRSSRVPSK